MGQRFTFILPLLLLIAAHGLGGQQALARPLDTVRDVGAGNYREIGPGILKMLLHIAVDGAKDESENGQRPTATTSKPRRRVDENVDPNTLCSEFLLQFLEGATDAEDTCDGIKNAYIAADCAADDEEYDEEYDNDDYFEAFTEHTCCNTLMTHYSGYCTEGTLLTNTHLILAASALMLAECVKGLTKRYEINFIPEAGICILVGTFCGLIAKLIPGVNIDDMSFDDELFIRVLLPPIIFEAALAVSKTQFKKRRGAILFFAILGTLICTMITGLMVHYFSAISRSTTFPILDSLVFGALISSVDPVAILSVLTNLGLTQSDTVFILVFGESLLNDGIAITVFKALVSRFDGTNDGTASASEVFGVIADFLNAMFGAIAVAIMCGGAAWFYFYLLKKTLSPAMEVGSFFLWALVPFYISEAIGWSGIVSLVAMGFFMDIYIASPKTQSKSNSIDAACQDNCHADYYVNMGSEGSVAREAESIAPLSGTARMRLSGEAEKHIRFVAHLAAQLAENAIFAYLGLFLFSQHYVWDPALISIAIVSCIVSRALMVVFLSQVISALYICRGRAPCLRASASTNSRHKVSKTAVDIRDPRTQAVLILAGLRGAVSLALVEDIPIYNGLTGDGCEVKGLMKGMTSATIIFTTFVLGGGAYYLLPLLGFSPSGTREEDPPTHSVELAPTTPFQGMGLNPQLSEVDSEFDINSSNSMVNKF